MDSHENKNLNVAKALLRSLQKIEMQLAIIEINEEFKINTPKTSQEIIDRIIDKMVLQDSLKLIKRDLAKILGNNI